MIQALIPIVGNLAGSWLQGKADEKKATSEAKVAKAKAEAEVMKVAATHEAGWEKIMAQGSLTSWKDEWLTVLFSVPLILAFCGDWGRQVVSDGFAALSTMPEWYQYSLGLIVSATFAMRGASKFIGKK
jgi:hypothetical protein